LITSQTTKIGNKNDQGLFSRATKDHLLQKSELLEPYLKELSSKINHIIKIVPVRSQWLKSVILATQKAQIGRTEVLDQTRLIVLRPHLQNN
jgi:hypothetical protein